MYTDLFVHQLTHLIQAMGVRFPRRVVGAGGLYLEYDGRDVPDVATVVADYDEGCQVMISATMCNDVQLGEVIRGHTGDDHVRRAAERRVPRRPAEARGPPGPSGHQPGEGGEQFKPDAAAARTPTPSGSTSSSASARATPRPSARPSSATPRSPRSTWASSPTAKARPTTSTRRPARSPTPTRPGPSSWEKVSHVRGKPNQVIGWKAGDEGSLLHPPDYQKLEGDWVDGKDPPRPDLLIRCVGRTGNFTVGRTASPSYSPFLSAGRLGQDILAGSDQRPLAVQPDALKLEFARPWSRENDQVAGLSLRSSLGGGCPSSRAGLSVTVASTSSSVHPVACSRLLSPTSRPWFEPARYGVPATTIWPDGSTAHSP